MPNERARSLLQLLSAEQETSVKSLAAALFVSESTIRRDLAQLAAQNEIIRTYRGAKLRALSNEEKISFLYRSNHNVEAKNKMAAAAMKYIREHDVVMLDDSSSAMFLVPYMAKQFKDLVVMTNGLRTAYALCEYHIRNYMIGGWAVNLSQLSYMGPYAEHMLKDFHANVTFISCKGLSMEGNLSSGLEDQDELRKIMIKNSRTSILLCDSSKIGKVFKHDFANVTDLDDVISEKPLPDELARLVARRKKIFNKSDLNEYRIENA